MYMLLGCLRCYMGCEWMVYEMRIYMFVEWSPKSQHDGGEFDHLIAYSLACMFENEVVSARKYEGLCFTWWSDQSGRLSVPWWRQRSAHGRFWGLLEWSSLMGSVEPSRGSKTEATRLSLGWSSGSCSGQATISSSQYAFLFYVRFFVGFCGFVLRLPNMF